MEIEINNTSTSDDDWVMQCTHDPRHTLTCRIRTTGSPANDVATVLTNPDGRLRFPGASDASTTVTVPSDGSWLEFQISGNTGSATVGDAVIEAHCQDAAGAVLASKGVTVVAVEREGLFDPEAAIVELPDVNNMNLLPIADRVAHRTIKFKFVPTAFTRNKSVEWSFSPSGIQGGVLTDGVQRGVLPAGHNTHIEAEPGFNFDAATHRSTINANGTAAVRINMPSVAFNKGRLGVRMVDRPDCVTEVDFEVQAVVVIDPGHGGNAVVGGSSPNNATSFSGVLEKDMTLDFSRLVRDALNADPHNIEVHMTRNADVNLGIAARANVARDNSADVLLSIHMNAFNGVAHGTTIFVRTNGVDQLNHADDAAFATRVVDAVLAVNPVSDRAQNLNDFTRGPLRDSALGNNAAHHKTRACLLEVDFIDVQRVDENLNTGPDATANRQAICNAIAGAIIDDLLNQP
ncbi:N-acetylmuramoyl-L-alanine amidase [Luteimonas salinilitoris]|uniref:N-acetylmuramoyl-L-alanine amidase n=1 Tax=Luteimonas salinilitoris TaxID=3237697 RepID=A0ABV4HRU5_9GAMM